MNHSRLFALLILIALVLMSCTPKSRDEGIEGFWESTLKYPGIEERIVFKFFRMPNGTLKAALLRPDVTNDEIPVSKLTLEDGHLYLEITSLNVFFDGQIRPEGSVIEGQWKHRAFSQPLSLRRVTEVSKRRRPQEPVPPYPYDKEDVVYTNTDAQCQLAGTLTLPHRPRPCPAVLLVSGGGAQNRDGMILGHRPFLVLADYLSRRGIAVLRADDRGVGASTGDRSRATSEDYAEDALAGIGFLKGRSEINPSLIGLIGHSEGGIIAALAAAQSRDVAFVVMMASPGLPGREYLLQYEESIQRALGLSEETVAWNRVLQDRILAMLEEEEKNQALTRIKLRQILEELDPPVPQHRLQAALKRFLSPWHRFLVRHDNGATLRKVKCPVLAIFAEKDIQVPPNGNLEAVEHALKSGGNKDYRVEKLPGLNHLFQTAETGAPSEYAEIEETLSPVALGLIAGWLREHTEAN